MEKIYEMIMTMANRDFRVFPGLRQKLVMGSVFLLVFLFAGTQVSAAVTTNTTLAALQSAIDAASSNDVIVLADATYTDNFTLTIGKSGITVRPATLGGAYLNNIAAISISGNNITFSGFRFTSRAATNGTIITVSGDRNLLTQLNFNGYNAEKYINLQGRYNEVSYCNFQNKPVTAQIGNLIQISPDYSLPGYNKIRHCSFQNSTNGNECIRISDDATSTYVSRTIIEFNYFNNTGLGDAISVKCRENVLRYNTMTNNLQGDFCFKNGDNNIAYGNFFLNSGGIRVEKANNIYCYNNYFENCGDSVVTAPVKYVYVSPNLANINFIHNTFVGGTSIELTNSAAGNTWANNIFSNTSANIFMGSAAGIKWAGNQYSGTLDIPIASGMTRTNSLLVRNSDGYYGLSANSPAIQAASTNYPAILDIANVDDDPALTMDISGQSRPSLANLKDVGSVQFGTTGTLNRPLSTNDVGPVYLSGPRVSPSVSLTAPFAQQEFLAPASITLTAEASSAIGTVTNVSFYSGTNLLGTDTTAPYAYTWTGVPAGSYSLTARAMDNSGVVGTSTVAVITVLGAGITTNSFTTAGSADWTCPANVTSIVVECWGGGGAGGSAQRTSGTIAQYGGGGAGGAYVRSNVYKVVPDRKYYMNVGEGGFNNYIDNDSTVSGGDSWFDSSFAIIAKGGAGGESAIGSTTATGYGLGGTGTTSGSAAGGVVYAGGSGAAGASSGAGGGGSSAGTAANGTSATSNTGAAAPTGGGNGGTGPTINEAAGGKGSAPGGGGSGGMSSSSMLKAGGPGGSGWVVLTFVSNAAPIVSLTAPANGAGFFAPASIGLTANASDADGVITNVSFYSVVSGVTNRLASYTNSPYAYTWTGVAAGSYSLTAQATDNSGLVRTSAVAVITVVNPTYTLTVNGGSGSGPYTNGTQVAIAAAPVSGKVFSRWIGDTQYVDNVTYTNALVTMTNTAITLTATFDKSILTVNSGTGGGAYTNGQRVTISASNINGRAFYQWTGDTSVLSSNKVSTTFAMSTNPVTLTATYTNLPGYYTLTVNNGSGNGSYTSAQVVPIAANPPAAAKVFYQWTGDTQYVNNVTYTNAQVTMTNTAITLTATYVDVSYTLTVNGGTGGGLYTNGAQVTIMPSNVPEMAFDRWTGDTNVLSNVFVFGHIVTMSTNAVSLTAIFNDATNGVVNVNWAASGGFYYRADPSIGILGPSGSGQSTIAQLMYSPNNVKDNILPSGVGAVNDVVWDTITITENGNGVTDWAVFNSRSVVRAWTNGYVYALIFQDNNVQAGDWYYSTPLVALEKIATNGVSQNIEMNTDVFWGDPIDGTNGNQVIAPIVLTVNSGSGSGTYTNGQQVAISANPPAAAKVFYQWTGATQYVNNVAASNATVTLSTNAVILTATYADAYYTLTVNGGRSSTNLCTNGTQVAIFATNSITGRAFDRWAGDTQYVASITASNTTVTMPAANIALTATFTNLPGYYTLTVNSGTGSGPYTNGTKVTIAASDLRSGVTFKAWIGSTQYVNNVTYTNALVTMTTNAATLTATYYYTLTVTNGTASAGPYTNGQQVAISADAPAARKAFGRWTGDTQVVASVTASNTTITLSTNPVSLTATYVDASYALTVNSGSGSGPYTNGTQVAIAANPPVDGRAFDQWIGDEAALVTLDNPSASSTTATMQAYPVTLTATYTNLPGRYTLTVNSGTGSGAYTNAQVVAIAASDTRTGVTFKAWTGDTQYVNNVTASNTTVTMTNTTITLTATYYYDLTVTSGTGGGSYTNGAQVNISASNLTGTVFDKWTGATNVLSSNTVSTTVTLSTNPVALTATYSNLYYALTVTSGTGGGSYTYTQEVAIAASNAVSGRAFDRWAGSGAAYVASITASNTTVTMPATNIALTATYTNLPSYYTLTVNSGSGSGAYTNAQVVAIAASDTRTGVTFKGWIGDTNVLSSNTVSTTVTMTTNPVTTLTATYYYDLTVNSGTGGGSYTNGTQVAIAANPPVDGRAFDQWIGGTNVLSGNTASATVTMSTNPVTLTATYTNLPDYYSLTVNSGSGSGAYTSTQVVAIAASDLRSGVTFKEWIGDTQVVNNVTASNTTVTMTNTAITLTATYYYDLTVTSGAGGGSYTNGAQVGISASNLTGAVFDKWTGATQVVNNVTNTSVLVTMSTNPVVLTATYSNLYYTLTVNSGTGSGSCTYTQVVTISASTNNGRAFDQWVGDTSVLSSNTASTTFTMSTNAVTLTATFTNLPGYFNLTVTGGSGSGAYTNTQVVSIVANTPAAGKVFSKWIGDTKYVNNVTNKSALVTMSTNPVNLTAAYKDDFFTLTVDNGTGGGSYTNREQVAIAASDAPFGMIFSQWTGIGARYAANSNSASTTVTMPATNTALAATYKGLPYALTVNSGTGGGSYTNGTQVPISASDLRSGVTFKAWIGDTQVVNNVTYTNASVTMTNTAITLTATYYYTLTVTNGTADSGPYTNMQVVAIAASNAPSGMIFDRWTGNTQVVAVASVTASNTTVTFSTNPVSLTATYANLPGWYTLTVNSGFGSGVYSNGVQVAIAASNAPSGRAFDRWIGNTAYVANSNSASTTVTMTNTAITLTATYTNLPGYNNLTVNSGSGSGAYTNGTKVAIAANTPVIGKAFSQWTGDTAYAANSNSASTTVTMTNTAITLTATYVDVYYTLTVNSGRSYTNSYTNGTSIASYTNGTQVAVAADNQAFFGNAFKQWTGGGTQYVANVTASNTTMTMPAINTALTATFQPATYALTINSGSGSGSYNNGTKVTITANDLAGTVFYQWTWDTNSVSSSFLSSNTVSTTVTMMNKPIALTATYSYLLTVYSGSGSGLYTNGRQVAISADAPVTGMSFDRWTGDTQRVNNVTYTNALVAMTTNAVNLTATYKILPGYYTLTVNNGLGSGPYTNGQQAAIEADAPVDGKVFSQWIGDAQGVASVTSASTTVTMSTNAVSLTATYTDAYYALTVNNGTGDGSYTNGTQVAISADAPASGLAFSHWIGDTQIVDNATYTNAVVTMPMQASTLTATYTDATYPLTVNNGTGSGSYTNGAQVMITATNTLDSGAVFDRWIGDTQAVASVSSLSTIVTMSTNPVTLTASCVDATNGVVSVSWGASAGFYFSADPNAGILGPVGSGKSTIAQLMYSPDNVKDGILPSRAGGVNDVVLDTVIVTETNAVLYSDYAFFAASTVRAWTNGYVYALIFQDDNVQAGDWYYSTPLEPLNKTAGNTIEMNIDTTYGDPIDGVNGAQVIDGIVLTVNSGSGSGSYTNGAQVDISANTPASGMTFYRWIGATQCVNNVTYTNALVTMTNTAITLTATYTNLPDWYALTVISGSGSGLYTNKARVNISASNLTGKVFDKWTGATQYVNNVTYTNALVTMTNTAITLTATYKNIYTLTGSAGANGAVSPASTNVVAGNSATFVITATNLYRIATLTTNGTAVTGMSFDNGSTNYNYTWSNVQYDGTLAATFTAQVTTNTPAGVPLPWLAGYGLTNYEADAVLDQDSDGLKTWQEYIAGTDPNNAASCLKASLTTSRSNLNVIAWSPVTGRVYSVYWSTNLMKGFTNLNNNILYPTNSFTNATPDSRLNHYQVKVRMQ